VLKKINLNKSYLSFKTDFTAEFGVFDPMFDKATCLICWVRPQLFNVLPSKSLNGNILRLYRFKDSVDDDLNLLLKIK